MLVFREEQVLGLQIPMNDALLVSRGEALRNLQRVLERLLCAIGPRASLPRSVSPSSSSMTA